MKQMNEAQTLKTLQLFYAGALVDAVRQYHMHGVLETVTEGKRTRPGSVAASDLRVGIHLDACLISILDVGRIR